MGSEQPADLIAGYLARRDVADLAALRPGDTDVLVVCGSAVLATVEVAAEAFHRGLAPLILVSGGVGHSTAYLVEALQRHPTYADVPTESRSEAAMLADVLHLHHGVPAEALLLEEASTSCGQNAELSVELLLRQGI